MNQTPKSISAQRPKRESGHRREQRRKGGHNVIWKRMTASFEELKRFGANPALATPLTRWVVYKHLTDAQGMAGRRFADIVGQFERYHVGVSQHSAQSANLEPVRKGEEDVIAKHMVRGTIDEYEADARHAKRQYKRLMKVMDRYVDTTTGRNFATENLRALCIEQKEPPAEVRPQIAAVLSEIAKEFGLIKAIVRAANAKKEKR